MHFQTPEPHLTSVAAGCVGTGSDELSGKPHCPTAHIWDAKVRTEKAYAASRRCMLAANAPTDSCFCEPTPHS